MFNLTPWRRNHPERGEFTRGNAHPLARFRDEMDALFNQFFGNWPEALEKTFGRDRFWALDFDENEKEYILKAEAPGVEAAHPDRRVSGNMLTPTPHHKQQKPKKNGDQPSATPHLHPP